MTPVHDPREGITPAGTICTGVARGDVGSTYAAIIGTAIDAVGGRGALYMYGSVATGTAVVPRSDVDLLSIGLPSHEAARISAELSARFEDVCREVSIGPATWEDQMGVGRRRA